MTYTSHGHHIDGSPMDSGDAPQMARCGGPGLCGLCTQQSFFWRQEAERTGILAKPDEQSARHEGILTPIHFQSKIVDIHAVQFTGGAANGMDIVAWVNSYGGNATWNNAQDPWTSEDGTEGHGGYPESLTIQYGDTYPEVPVGHWVILGTEGEFYSIPDAVLRKKYEEVVIHVE
jgi:hypothetical protein